MRPGKTNLPLHTFIIAYVITSISVFANGPSSSSTVNFAIRCLLSLTTRRRHLPPSRHHTLHRLEHYCRRTNRCHAFQPPSTTNSSIKARSTTSRLVFCLYYDIVSVRPLRKRKTRESTCSYSYMIRTLEGRELTVRTLRGRHN